MRPAKEILTRYAVLLLGAAILSFGLFNVHSQSGVTEGGVLGTTLLLHHWFGISPGVSEFVIDVICYALGFRFLGKAFFKYAIAASAGFACFYMLWERVGPVLPDLSGQPLTPRRWAECSWALAWALLSVRAARPAATMCWRCC
ncbi:MAG: YitT family protein [Ruthenibacterium lactatiformans]